MSPPRTLILLVMLIGALIPGVPLRAAPPMPDPAPDATALVQAANGTLLVPGPAVALPIQVTNVQKLGAATVLVTYDPASVKAAACQRNTAFDVGLCNTAYDRNADGTADAVLFNVVSLQGVSAGETPVALVNITWQAASGVQPPAYADLGVQVQTFADVDANPLAVTAQGGRITIEIGSPPAPTYTLFLPLVSRFAVTP